MFGQVRVYLTSKKKEDEPSADKEDILIDGKSAFGADAQAAMDELDDLFK